MGSGGRFHAPRRAAADHTDPRRLVAGRDDRHIKTAAEMAILLLAARSRAPTANLTTAGIRRTGLTKRPADCRDGPLEI